MSPKRNTRGDPLQYVKLKEREGTIKEVAVWGHEIPEEGIVTISNLMASKLADLGTSRQMTVEVSI